MAGKEEGAAGTEPLSMNVKIASARGWRQYFREFLALAGPYWTSGQKWIVIFMTIALIALTVGQVVVQIVLNLWIAKLFDSLAGHSLERFLYLLGILAAILGANLAVGAFHMFIRRWLQVGWRQWLTRRVSEEWMNEGRQYQITYIPGEHDNPDGRIAEDIRNATEFAINLGHSLVYCILLLVSFIKILWSLSGNPDFDLFGFKFHVPAYLVWMAIGYAAVGIAIAWLLGRPMVRASDRRQTFEANFRFGLVRARENALAVALLHGEGDERLRFRDLFKGAAEAWNRQTRALLNFFFFQTTWSVLLQVFPILVAAPQFIIGAITLGALMQISQAFQQAVSAMSWPIDNLSQVADWRASAERVLNLHEAVQRLIAHTSADGKPMIDVVATDGTTLAFRHVDITDPNGIIAIRECNIEWRLGERALISGDTSAALKLFKAVARLWPWGSGKIELPNAAIFFATQHPYLPIGTLRSAIAYPAAGQQFEDGLLLRSLEKVGLHHLSTELDRPESWDQLLTADEQQRLGFARLLLHRPAWIFLQEATDALDEKSEAEMMTLLETELPDATVITIGNHSGLVSHHRRFFTMVRHDGYSVMEEKPAAGRVSS